MIHRLFSGIINTFISRFRLPRPSTGARIICAAHTDKGARMENQDSVYLVQWDNNSVFGVIADGMGSSERGKLAARSCTSHFKQIFRTRKEFQNWLKQEGFNNTDASFPLRKIASDINQKIYETNTPGEVTGTTCTAVLIMGESAWYVHCGDSRLYCVRDKSIKQITTDHSWVQETFVKPGLLSNEEARHHSSKHLITSFIGIGSQLIDIDVSRFQISNGDILLLCSDGLSNVLDDALLQEISVTDSPAVACKNLVKSARQSAGKRADNISVIVVRCP